MIFATPWGLLALAAMPAIIAIHLFRRRFPVRPVAGLFLWQVTRQTPEGGGRIAKLPITASLLLECLAALALALILAGARFSPAVVAQHLVVLLDDSASMAAAGASGGRTRDRAVRRVLSEIERLPSGGRVTIIQSGERPSILVGPAAIKLEARSALEAWNPEAQHHTMSLGLRLARELAGQTGMVMVVSDMAPASRGEAQFDNGLWVSLGEPAVNVGVTAAQRTAPQEGRPGNLFLTLTSNGAATVKQRLSVVAGGREVLARELDVPPGSSTLTLSLPAGTPTVTVALQEDALRRDNEVTLAEPRSRMVAVENGLPEGRGRTALINALNALSGVTTAASGHLAFTNAADLDRPRTTDVWRVGFGRPPASWVAPGGAQDLIGPFVMEKRHPLLLGMTLDGVVWSGAVPLVRDAIRPVVSSGDQMLAGMPLGAGRTGTSVLFNIDLDRTNLVRSPDWPILISNLVEMRRQSLPGPERWNYRSGEWIRARLDRDPAGPLRYRCGPIERTIAAGRQIEFIAPSPGGLLQILEGDQVLFEVGVNFLDEVESSLADRSTADAGKLADASGMRAEAGAASDPLFWILLAVGGIAMLVNYCLNSAVRHPRLFRRPSWS
ncbi:MAG TPA: BatA domain-containing protein [Vicinamibacterales bacterium]|nr:BatA domain-containing protein [Vicinamibacterales bacterium]